MEGEKEVIISAPGKLILHGEHAVVYGKRALAGSLNIRTFLRLRQTCSGVVELNLPDVNVHAEWLVEEVKELKCRLKKVDFANPGALSEEHLSALKEFTKIDVDSIETRHLALVAFLHLFTSLLPNKKWEAGFEVQVGSRLPPSAGLGSSAAYSTCLSAGLLLLAGHIAKPITVENETHSAWTDSGDLEIINRWAFQSEKILHGKPSGIDNAVSTFGGTVIFQNGKVTPVERTPQLDILLTNTKVPRSTKLLVAGVAERHKKFPGVIDPLLSSIEEITKKCEELFSLMLDNSGDSLSQVLAYSDLGELIEVNQNLLAALGVSHPTLERVCRLSETHGMRSKLTGAGGGGCAFTLIPPGTRMSDEEQLVKSVRDAGFDCWRTEIGGPGVTFHDSRCKDTRLPESFLKPQ